MLKPTRLTFDKTTRSNLTPSVGAAAPRVLAFGALVFLLNGGAVAVDDVRNAPRPLAVQRLTPTQPSLNKHLTPPPESTQDLASALAQLEFRFQEAQKIGSERLDQLAPQITELLGAARRLETLAKSGADVQQIERAQSFVSQLVEFQSFLDDASEFFHLLAQLDVASLNDKTTRDFFNSILSQSNVSNAANAPNATIADYRAELNRVAASFDALSTLERWNDFVETSASELERFYVAPDDAENALDFIAQTYRRQGLPREFQILERRAAEWRFISLNRVAIQRKILLALESELTAKYWTFAATPDKIYYLQQPPRPGRNVCFADAQGALGFVEIPTDAPETATDAPTQRLFLQSLADEARSIPETLRVEDAARWYAAWSNFLLRLQGTDALDPLVKFRLLRNIATTLSTGDYYFAQRLAPTLRMLNVPRLSAVDALDVFQAEDIATQGLRRLAQARIAFLPTDRLTVDKTTAQLDAQMECFSFVYRRVGWLDRDFSGAWRCRRPENAPLPVGDLYVLLAEHNAATNEKSTGSPQKPRNVANSSEASPHFRWLKIGSSDGRQITLKFATPHVSRGSIVLCRSRVGTPKTIVETGELERLIRR